MQKPPTGAHIATSRVGYTHHGIYVGDDKVIHYAGLSDGLKTGPVEETDLDTFAGGHGWWIKTHHMPMYSGAEALARARSRIGENLYCLFACNCEHFVEWAINDRHLSKQVDRGTMAGGVAMSALAGKVAIATIPAAAAATTVATSGAGLMSGLAAVGGMVAGGAAAGVGVVAAAPALAAASIVNATVLKKSEAHDDVEREARAAGRKATIAAAATGAVGAVATVAAVGVPGLSAVGITTGLAGVGAAVGGGMAAGIVVAAAAPVALATVAGIGAYKLVRHLKRSRATQETKG